MQFQPSRDQRELVASMDTAIAATLPVARWHDSQSESEQDWATLQELGIFDLAKSEADGGVGLGAVEEALLALALGRQLAAPSIIATMGAVHAETSIAAPRVAAAFAGPSHISLINDPHAAHMLVRGPQGATINAVPPSSSAHAQSNPWIDSLHPLATAGDAVTSFNATGLLRLRLLDAAALAGLAHAAMNMAVDYAKMREQFGRVIGSYQAIKHHCANMAVAARSAEDLVTFAAVALDQQRSDAPVLVDSALRVAAEAASGNAAKNIQIHGGIGFSAEADTHLFVKRAQILTAYAGGTESGLSAAA